MIIEAQNLVKRYGRVYGLKKASFRVEQGKITGLLGPNGAGKTTTMRILTTFLKPTSGEAWVNGHSIFFEGYKIRKEIGYLPEHSPIYPEMTVQEYLHFRAALKRVDRKKRKKEVEELMANFGLSTYAHRLISELSKGYRQRVGFCEALLGYPPLMILDEPTSGMDPLQKNELLQWIQSLVPDHSILFSSHILRDVERICSHVIILNQGEVMAQG
ncbi:MAG: ABC transporter ATP-binding protein, partial [Planctomycetota bacterium]